MTPTDWPLVAPNRFVLLFPVLIGALLPLGVLAALVLVPQRTPIPWMGLSPLALMPLIAIALSWDLSHGRVRLSEAGLRVRTMPWPRTIPLSAIDLERAEVVDLEQRKELQPRLKIAGTRLPGYRAGRFRLRDKRMASVLLTDLRRVLVLPLRDGSVLLLSVERADALLQALRRRG
jgi:hypothetical protein